MPAAPDPRGRHFATLPFWSDDPDATAAAYLREALDLCLTGRTYRGANHPGVSRRQRSAAGFFADPGAAGRCDLRHRRRSSELLAAKRPPSAKDHSISNTTAPPTTWRFRSASASCRERSIISSPASRAIAAGCARAAPATSTYPNSVYRLCGSPDELEQGCSSSPSTLDESSRLSCQINVTEEMEGMRVRMPPRQY